jgi:hypothetical protein
MIIDLHADHPQVHESRLGEIWLCLTVPPALQDRPVLSFFVAQDDPEPERVVVQEILPAPNNSKFYLYKLPPRHGVYLAFGGFDAELDYPLLHVVEVGATEVYVYSDPFDLQNFGDFNPNYDFDALMDFVHTRMANIDYRIQDPTQTCLKQEK